MDNEIPDTIGGLLDIGIGFTPVLPYSVYNDSIEKIYNYVSKSGITGSLQNKQNKKLFNGKLDIPYGKFAAIMLNADRNGISRVISCFIIKYRKEDNISKRDRLLIKLWYRLEQYIALSASNYLYVEIPYNISGLLFYQIFVQISAEDFDIANYEHCIPSIFWDTKLRELVRDILLRKVTDVKLLAEYLDRTYTSDCFLTTGESVYNYHLRDVTDYLLLDLHKYLECSKITLKECERCGRLFNPKRKSDKYCQRIDRKTSKTCAEYMYVHPDDKFAVIRNKARDRQHKQRDYYINKNIYDKQFLLNLYDGWSKECSEKIKEFKKTDDFEGFSKWIEETELKKGRINALWEEYKMNNGSEENIKKI